MPSSNIIRAEEISAQLASLADPARAKNLQRFFKTGPEEYGEGDIFMGIRVPQLRKLVRKFKKTSLKELQVLLRSPIHEERLMALLLLVQIFSDSKDEMQERTYRLYLENTGYINNWDLVDVTAPNIVGAYLFSRKRDPIYTLARSDSLWERRIAIMATFYFIKRNDFGDTLNIADLLIDDKEDLIHKALGWMLREIGKCDLNAEETFLKKRYKTMPRTMLRYAIEKFPEEKRKDYLKGLI